MPKLSPAAQAVWEAFNEDEAGVFVDDGMKLAAALRAVADQVVSQALCVYNPESIAIRSQLLVIANELEAQ